MRVSTGRETQTSPALGKHFYQFYKGREDFFRFAVPFLLAGLNAGEACFWVVSDSIGVLEAVQAFRGRGDVSRFVERSQLLIIPAERWYLDRGRFSERTVLGRARKFMEEKTKRGFRRFRGAADLGWLAEKDWEKFQAYEEKVHEWIRTVEVTTLCAYPIHRCSLTQTNDILVHHDSVFLSKL